MGEKTEQATPKKLRDARKKGQVAKSQDFPTAFTFITSISVALSLVEYIFGIISEFYFACINSISSHHGTLTDVIPALYYQAAYSIFAASIPVLIAVVFMGVLINFITVGPVFALEVFKPDIKKFNPVDNLKNKFKMKTLVELLKQIFKISVASYLIYGVMLNSIPMLTQLSKFPMIGALAVFHSFLMEVVIKVGLFFIVVAVADLAYQKYNFAKEMKMEKFEIKQEYKNSEGDPQIKGKRKQIAQETAYQDAPAAGVKQSKAVVTNPTHLAIAIGYERDIDPAPFILAKGDGALAKRMVKLAELYEVPIMRNIPLAHDLWDNANLYEYAPEETYEALSEVLRWVASLDDEDQNKPSYYKDSKIK